MRQFHRLIKDSEAQGYHRIVKYDIGGFDHMRLWEAQPLNADEIGKLVLSMRPGAPVDYLGNPLSIPICSERFCNIITRRCGPSVQIFDASIYSEDRTTFPGYYIVNPLRKINCLNLKHCTTSATRLNKSGLNVIKFAFRPSAIPSDVHLFRVPEALSDVFIFDELASDMVGKRLTGLCLVRAKSVE